MNPSEKFILGFFVKLQVILQKFFRAALSPQLQIWSEGSSIWKTTISVHSCPRSQSSFQTNSHNISHSTILHTQQQN